MTPHEDTRISRPLKTWERARNILGALVIFAVIAATVNGVIALKNERDATRVMKLPVALAFFSIVAFVHAQKKILSAKSRSSPTEPISPRRGDSS